MVNLLSLILQEVGNFFFFDLLNKTNVENKHSPFDKKNYNKNKKKEVIKPKISENEILNDLNNVPDNK